MNSGLLFNPRHLSQMHTDFICGLPQGRTHWFRKSDLLKKYERKTVEAYLEIFSIIGKMESRDEERTGDTLFRLVS